MVPLLAARPIASTADFRRFGHPQTLPINHLLCENRRTQGRMGEVGLVSARPILPVSLRGPVASTLSELLWRNACSVGRWVDDDPGDRPGAVVADLANAHNPDPARPRIRLVKKLTRKNQQCEDIEYTVRSGGKPAYTEHYHFTSCLQPDGTWKIA